MFVQGLGRSSQINAKQKTSIRSKTRSSNDGECALPQENLSSRQNNVSDRDALLKKIKGKIQNGFYNSDAVAEDLSDGFAKLFDERV
jgi:anti-sigma28 factor (negative regulator of flagellin synthesis)